MDTPARFWKPPGIFCLCITGRKEISRIGGGLKVVWHMTDLTRINETEEDPKIEVVKDIIPEQTR